MRRYWDEDLRHFGKQFAKAKGGYVHQEPGVSAEDEFFASFDLEREDLAPELFLALRELTPKQRFVIECHYGLRGDGGMTVREIGIVLGVSHQAVMRLIQRGLKRLERELWTLAMSRKSTPTTTRDQ